MCSKLFFVAIGSMINIFFCINTSIPLNILNTYMSKRNILLGCLFALVVHDWKTFISVWTFARINLKNIVDGLDITYDLSCSLSLIQHYGSNEILFLIDFTYCHSYVPSGTQLVQYLEHPKLVTSIEAEYSEISGH